MAYSLTWLPDVLRAAGLKVAEVPGWKTRGHGDMGKILGVLCHHTAGPAHGDAPSLAIVRDGRPDLKGPLAQLVLGRDGTFHVVAAGLSWHAGAGNWRGVTRGNSNLVGIEAENTGLANDNPWPAVQMDAYVRGVVAILKHVGAPAVMAVGHLEYALPVGRKSDPSFSIGDRTARMRAMEDFRKRVGVAMLGQAQPHVGLLAEAVEGPGDYDEAHDIPAPALIDDGPGDHHASAIAPAGDLLAPGVMTSIEITGAQQLLHDLKYFEIGLPNGQLGSRTAAAIAAFKHDRGLTGAPVLDRDLLVELDRAKAEGFARPIANERAEGEPEGSRITAGADRQATAGVTAGAGLVAIALQKIDAVQSFVNDHASFISPIEELAKEYWYVLAAAFLVYVLIEASHIRKARVEDHQTGKTT